MDEARQRTSGALTRRALLKAAVSAGAGVALAPMFNRGRFRLFANSSVEYSARARYRWLTDGKSQSRRANAAGKQSGRREPWRSESSWALASTAGFGQRNVNRRSKRSRPTGHIMPENVTFIYAFKSGP